MPEDIIIVLLTLLSDNWDPSRTLGQTPPIGAGHIDGQGPAQQVLVAHVPNEDALGFSGIYGIAPDTGDPIQLFRGLAFIECVAEVRDDLEDPDIVTRAFSVEVRRILQEHGNNVADYDYVRFIGVNRIGPKLGQHPQRIVRSCRIGYQWRSA